MRSFIASIRPDATPLLSRTLSKVLVTASFLVLPCSLVAQTAQFSGSVFTRGSGFGNPVGVAVDSSGNLFVADEGTAKVYELLAAGGYTTLITLSTQFTIPTGIAVDGNENVFVTDQGTGRVYEMLAAGGYTTANQLGSGFSNPNGVAVDASGNVFVADTLNNLVKEILAVNGSIPSSNPTINTLGQANGNFNHPTSVAVDASGNVFVADSQNSLVKEIAAAGGYITVNILGTNFSYDNGVALDGSGNLYVVDSGHHVIKELLAVGGYTTENTLDGVFNYPANAAVDGSGNVYVADYSAGAVYEIMRGGVDFGFLPVGTSTPGTRTLTFTFDSGGTGVTEAVSTQGAPGLDFIDAGTGSCHTNGASYSYAIGDTCTVDVTFTPLAPGGRDGAVILVNTLGAPLATVYIYGIGNGPEVAFSPGVASVLNPSPLALGPTNSSTVDGSGNVYVTDYNNNRVVKFPAAGTPSVVSTLGFTLHGPDALAVDGAGNLYISDELNSRIIVVATSGVASLLATPTISLGDTTGVAVSAQGTVYISDASHARVVKVTTDGIASIVPTGQITLQQPFQLALDGFGNLYIADAGLNRVIEIHATDGTASALTTGSLTLSNARGVTADAAGTVYISDGANHRIIVVPTAGAAFVLGTGSVPLDYPTLISVRNGKLYIPDYVADQVVELDTTAPPSFAFASTVVGATSSDSPQTATITNIGDTALAFAVPTAGLNPSVTAGFTFSNVSTCPQLSTSSSVATLAAGALCDVSIGFVPVAGGSITGALVLTDTNLNAVAATQTIFLSGSGIAVASKLAFTGVATTLAAGGNLGTIGVSVETSSGSVFTNSSASITVTITGPGGYSQSAIGAAASGVASLNLSSLALTTAGTYTVTASSPGLTPAISTVTVTAGAASQLVTSAVPATVASGGNLGTLGVAIEDRFGNVVTTSSAMVTVTITGPGGYSHAVTGNAVNGVASIHLTSLVFTTAGTYTVTTTSGSLSSVQTFVIAANATATVTALTSSNLAPTYGQSITLTATITPAPTAAPPGSISFYAGTTLLGTQALNAHGIGALSLSLPLGPNTITAVYSGSAGFAASTSSPLSVSARALSAITFSANPTTQLATMPVVFTALVSSATAGLQTGTVSFLNGSTVLATVTIVPGQPATYSETGLSSGTYSVTATYSGDGSFLPGASAGAPISITVSDLDLALGSDNNKSVVPGGAVTYNFPLSPVVTSTFIYSVALTATGLPPGATYTFSPTTIPAGSGSLPVAFTVQTAKTAAMLHRAPGSSRSPWFALLFGLLLPLAGAKRFRARLTTLPRMLLLLLFGGLSLGLVAGLGGCGSGGFLGSPPGQTSYTITISATSGTLVRTSTVQLSLE
jgi:sugar lactone lactonase YvrE